MSAGTPTGPDRAARGPGRRRTARQLDLLDRLVDLMTSEGFSEFTLDDIATRMRCSKTTLYALAPSKPELVVEVVKQYFRNSVPRMEESVAAVEAPADRVTAYLLAVADYLAPLSRDFMDDLATFAPAAEVYRTNTIAAANRIRDLIAEGIAAGQFRAVNAAFAAEMVAATMFEIQRGELFARLEMSDSEAYTELASLVVGALTV
ncbi:TetR/AcrR family transcriptional regulator [Nocardioides jensenii]|uniref:TetR/AcrR family transcriptional regulator n=1 Tax=Nocardioides jensenii TaxID=1843 RepID=UPI000830F4AC|nr:TetR/AcrR family transcriptional regulator [Nocardioides jensenii]